MSTYLRTKIICLLLILGVTGSTNKSTASNDAKPGCLTECGNLTVRYPFGIGQSCSLNPSFSLVCNYSYNPPRAFTTKLNSTSTRFQVFKITEMNISVNSMIAYNCPPLDGTRVRKYSSETVNFIPPSNSPFTVSTGNRIMLAGSCDYSVSDSTNGNEHNPCMVSCLGKDGKTEINSDKGCSSKNGCCDFKLANGARLRDGFSTEVHLEYGDWEIHTTCGYAVYGKRENFTIRNKSDFSDPGFIGRTRDQVPMVLDWVVGNQTCEEAKLNATYVCQQNTSCIGNNDTRGYHCVCNNGFEGNPYLSPGCTDIDRCASNPCSNLARCDNIVGNYTCSCPKGYTGDGYKETGCRPETSSMTTYLKLLIGGIFGVLSILIIITGINVLIRKHKLQKTREKFFKENGGLMLKEKLENSQSGRSYTSFKLFTYEELKRATKSFNKDLIIGTGGYGNVYKGTLQDKSLVAIKVSKLVDAAQIEQFINETLILTQIHHRNVVKLFGCCLEAEIPILVYEFVVNGSLQEHIIGKSYWLTWDNRLRIATEIATALGYLHSAASIPIIHRDIKSANILLDQDYNAKIADFGASRLIPMDKTQLSTLVQGTLGYMDPEYFLSSQLTDKSDVYSFGIVVAELLTGEEALSVDRRIEDRNLAKYFISAFSKGRLLDVIDAQIVDDATEEERIAVAKIIQKCLRRKGVDRPRMKDVASQLAKITNKGIDMDYGGSTQVMSISEYSFSVDPR